MGGVYFEALRGRNFIPPPFFTPPIPRSVFSVGVYKIWPRVEREKPKPQIFVENQRFSQTHPFRLEIQAFFGDRDMGGSKRTERCPESCPWKAWTPKLRNFNRISVEKGQFRDPRKFKIPPPPSPNLQHSSAARIRISTLRIWGFRGPGFRSVRQLFCGDATRLFLDHFSKHLSTVLGWTELSHEVRNPAPQKPQIIRNESHHLALLETFGGRRKPQKTP